MIAPSFWNATGLSSLLRLVSCRKALKFKHKMLPKYLFILLIDDFCISCVWCAITTKLSSPPRFPDFRCERVVHLLLKNEKKIDGKDGDKCTAQDLAAECGPNMVVQFFSKNVGLTDDKDWVGKTVLYWAAISGHETGAFTVEIWSEDRRET